MDAKQAYDSFVHRILWDVCLSAESTSRRSVRAKHHEPERTGSFKIRKVWLLGSDVMGLQVSRHRI